MTQALQSIKSTRRVVYTAWLAGKLLNHTLLQLRPQRMADSAYREFRPTAAGSGAHARVFTDDGEKPLTAPEPVPAADNPVLTSEDVTDYGSVDFVADPFVFPGADRWHMFFEVFNRSRDPDAVIGHATSPDGYEWEYDRVALNTGEHLSFPYVFEWRGNRYMLPETGGGGDTLVELYRAVDFPTEWRRCSVLVSGKHPTDDQVVFRFGGRWWLMVGDGDSSDTYLYHSRTLERDAWRPHPANPIVENRPEAYRPGGRPIVYDDRVVVFYQDCANQYGTSVRAYEITGLDESSFVEAEAPYSPVLEGTGHTLGWNSGRMHHIDPWPVGDRWFCAVDGNVNNAGLFTNDHWSIGVYSCPR